jgi:hypothetical protein
MPQMTSKTKSIGELFSGVTRFEVPMHQRDYSWTPMEVKELFADIETSQAKDSDSYYIGMLVLVEPKGAAGRYQILDGQQRLTTLTLIFAAARDWCKQNGLHVDAQRLQKEFIGFADYGQADHDPRIVLNSTNRDIFEQYVVNDGCLPEAAGLEKSNALLLSAKALCVDLLGDSLAIVKRKSDQGQKLYALVKFIRDAVHATVVEVREPEDAYTIFEALNDRGLELSIFDLLKNHVYRELGPKSESVATHHWDKLAVNLRDRKPDEFIRIFWMLRHGRIQKGTLFTRIREEYSGVSKAQALIKGMVADSELYASLDAPDGDTWQTYGDALREDVRSISILGGNQSRPVLLAALKASWREPDLKRLTGAIIALIVRHQIVGRERTGALEIFCADLSHEIFSNRLSPNDALAKVRGFYPDDGKFKADFAIFEETRAARAKYFLGALNRIKWKKANPNLAEEIEVMRDMEKVNVEHIYPKKGENNPSWLSVVKANPGLPDMVHRLGNQCLLAKAPNAKAGNKDIETKRLIYQRSTLPDTQGLGAGGTWTPVEIDARQKELAELAVRIWKV